MLWKKIGLIYHVEKVNEWMYSHAALPIARRLEEDIYRIYFSTRDVNNRSHGAFIDVDITNPTVILAVSKVPLVSPGKKGLFDDCGASLSCYVQELEFMYYLGWNLPKNFPFSNQIGVAKIQKTKLEKYSTVPILAKCNKEPYSAGYPWVMKADGLYKMWYDTNLSWNKISPEKTIFTLRYAESSNGIDWEKKYIDGITLSKNERSISRPCVLFENSMYKMWYCVNAEGKYRLGYAESLDGKRWTRMDDQVGIATSIEGWDSDEVCYPFVFDHKGERWMLYNGNGYGKTGFGLAVLRN